MNGGRRGAGRVARNALLLLLLLAACGGVQTPAPDAAVAADPAVGRLLVASCYPCHADGAAPPWNGRLAPSSWPASARSVLDFSQWATYDPARRTAAFRAIAAAVEQGSMPPGDYTFFDHRARLTSAERHLIAAWAAAQAAAIPPR